ncbi:MAG: carbon-nitrogen hydrolase family protein [Hyphomicrobiales bacterium]|nr:carbon-nitrogen hydrolase family protein [Hyphomicrobiales bacterium]
MSKTFKAACIQNCATPDVDENIDVCSRLVRQAAGEGATLIATAEYFSGLTTENGRIFPVAFAEADHPVIPAFAELARELGVEILLGSLGVTAPDGRIFNRSYMLSAGGDVTARYAKIHMFDVNLGEDMIIRESATIAPGDEAVLAPAGGTRMGLSVCYDLRFAGLYRALAHGGAEILAIPAAFTRLTGQAHWHVLNRARAIECGAFVIAPCQFGTLAGGAECFGHSLIVDPWGEVLADGGEAEGFAIAEIDLDKVAEARRRIPALTHDRVFTLDAPAQAAE